MLREEVTEAEVVDMEEDITAEDIMEEDTTVEDIMGDTIMAVVYAFFLEHTGDPASIIGDGHIIIPLIGGGPIIIPTIGDGHIPILPIPTTPILFLKFLRQNRKNSNLTIGISVRIQRVTTPTLKSVRAVGCRWYHR
jgi:hypothetical protein